jgi:hypothetical protein
MTIYAFPNITPTTQTFELVTNTKTFQSPLSNSIQTLARKGSHWKTSMTFNNLTDDERGILQGFITRLNGQEHRMRIRDYGQPFRGNAPSSDSPVIWDGASPVIDRLVLSNITPSIGSYLKRGDYVQVGNQLHQITHGSGGDDSDPLANSGGRCTAYIAPEFITYPAVNSPVILRGATGVFMMTNNPQWRTQAPYISSITIEAISDVLA